MAKHCRICSSSDAIQDKVQELHRGGQSYRNIEAALATEFDVEISDSSIGRHLSKCLKMGNSGDESEEIKEDDGVVLQEIEGTPLENTTVHKELCNVLANAIRIFNKRMNETVSSSVPYGTHLEAVKTLDILINAFDKLYQNPKEGVTQDKKKLVLSDLQVKLIHDVLTAPEGAGDNDLKQRVTEVFQIHETLGIGSSNPDPL
jgi:hypothetical protein